jgi:hypothetical protein
MAKIWPYRDGTLPTDESELWAEIPLKKCKELLSLSAGDYICDLSKRPIFDTVAKPPQRGVGVDMGAGAPVYRNVVVEVGEAEAISCAGDWKPGIYRVRSMTSAEVHKTLGLASTSGSPPHSA